MIIDPVMRAIKKHEFDYCPHGEDSQAVFSMSIAPVIGELYIYIPGRQHAST